MVSRRCYLAGGAALLVLVAISCTVMNARHGWERAHGPVVPHDQFPSDCALCHETGGWKDLKSSFSFDHLAETGYALVGAHASAQCLRCHNDRGPVQDFSDQGCVGCHVDSHLGELGSFCDGCHVETSWTPRHSVEEHSLTRFPLLGAHVSIACSSCHAGADGGAFQGEDPSCESCHQEDLARSTILDHQSLGLDANCERCHTPVGWENARFDHPASFPLTASHALSCSSCHAPDDFGGLSTSCFSCHSEAFTATVDPSHLGLSLSTDCTECHSTAGWEPAAFLHSEAMPLIGAHATPGCADCHTGGVSASIDTNCATCHIGSYEQTSSPAHVAAGFPTTCDTCHTATTWVPASFSHTESFPLSGAHGEPLCSACHSGGVYAGLSTACSSCHTEDYLTTTDPEHAAAGFPMTCDTCHGTASWGTASFSHPVSFPLASGHAGVLCAECHSGGVYTGLATACSTCHLADYQATSDPDHGQAGFSTTCESCHTISGWLGAEFEHTAAFPLTGAHTAPACADCHSGGLYVGLSSDCVSCHLAAYQSTTDPNHAALGYPTDCQDCHTTVGWTGASFAHTATFPLTSAHGGLQCADCHSGGIYTGLSTDCAVCHLSEFQSTSDPDHSVAGFPITCDTCHTPTSWGGASYIHVSSFPLSGGHASPACSDCHTGGVYVGLAADCVSCHLADYQSTSNPNHTAAGYPTDCQTCHTSSGWSGALFIHPPTFPLTGSHAVSGCNDCHTSGVYTGLSGDCQVCHIAEFASAANPSHVAAGFPTSCYTCHTTTTWASGTFAHTSSFPLTAAHASPACADCHTGGIFAGLPSDCVSCHLSAYQGTTNPNHAASGFPTTCDSCHSASAWLPASFSHTTTFPLSGGHNGLLCADCHSGGVYAGLATECATCHLPSYQSSTNPVHSAAGFSTTCDSCHTINGWAPAAFMHTTSFPLTAAHAAPTCADCHSGGVYSGLPSDCVSCHLSDYQSTTNPNHAAAGYPMDCQDCHSATTWTGATFTHTSTFPLTLSHGGLLCNDCHSRGIYAGLPSDCVSCHLSAYQGTTNPDHASAAFVTTCDSCHSPAGWTPALYMHTPTFPLTAAHAVPTCIDCHTRGTFAGLPSDCVSCHLADYQGTTNPNHLASSFPTTCDSCHTTSGWLGATFAHTTTFPLTGAHAAPACTDCHVGGVYTGLSPACASCHLSSYTSTTNPNHTLAAFTTTCDNCHTISAWMPSTYTHVPSFPLSGGHAAPTCNDCHGGGTFAGLPSDCVSCHLSDYQGTTNPNHATAGFPPTCDTCHTISGWAGATFNHPFPQGHGNANDCSDCHPSLATSPVFSCISGGCHPQGGTDNDHSEVGGYVYESTACLSCHPNGDN